MVDQVLLYSALDFINLLQKYVSYYFDMESKNCCYCLNTSQIVTVLCYRSGSFPNQTKLEDFFS